MSSLKWHTNNMILKQHTTVYNTQFSKMSAAKQLLTYRPAQKKQAEERALTCSGETELHLRQNKPNLGIHGRICNGVKRTEAIAVRLMEACACSLAGFSLLTPVTEPMPVSDLLGLKVLLPCLLSSRGD